VVVQLLLVHTDHRTGCLLQTDCWLQPARVLVHEQILVQVPTLQKPTRPRLLQALL
jgi:hypothetical protein